MSEKRKQTLAASFPPQVMTRFKPGLVDNPRLGLSGRLALGRFQSLLPVGTDPNMIDGPPQARELRRTVEFQAGTQFSWDDGVLEHIFATGAVPPRDEDFVVCTFIEGERETDYFHGELVWAMAQITTDRMTALLADKPAMVMELIAQLYLHRHRYVR